MARVKLVLKPADFPGEPDAATSADLAALFGHLFPGVADPAIPATSGAFGVVAQDPKLALLLVRLSDYIVREMPLTSTRRDLRELIVQSLNYHFRCDFSFLAHLKAARAAGVPAEVVAAIPFWRTANCFDDEQRLVIEYTMAVVAGDVPDDVFARTAAHFGERTTIEITTAAAWWSFWAMIINATRPEADFGYAVERG